MLALSTAAQAHGLIGKRFFPATLATDDPFVADELSLPTISYLKLRGTEDAPPTQQISLSGEFSKRLSPDLGLSLGGAFNILQPDDSSTVTGFDNLEIAAKYVFFKNAPHELLLAAGLGWDVGGTGSKKVDAESFSTWTPQLFFGKGFGDLPDQLELMKPFAITGVFGLALAVAGLGAINRYRVLPRLPTEAARARLTRLVAAEALLAVIVFGCTAVLAESTPKSHEGHMAHAAARLY